MNPTQKLRALLRQEEHRDGLDRRQMSALSGLDYSKVCAAIRAMPDVYIDRWVRERPSGSKRVVDVAVFCAVHFVIQTPPDCPRPRPVDGSRKPRSKK